MDSKSGVFLNLSDTVNGYLKTKNITPDGIKISTGRAEGTYYSKIKVFESYLLERKNLNDNNQWLYMVSQLTQSDIEESMEFYIDRSRNSENSKDYVRKKSVLKTFKTVVLEYLRYLSTNDIKVNPDLFNTFSLWDDDPKTFKKVLNRVAKNKNLDDSIRTLEPISEEEFQFLVATCDEIISQSSQSDLLNNGSHYIKYLRALIIKLMLFTGVGCKVIGSIKKSHLDFQQGTITINGFCLHLPKKLCGQLLQYSKLREIIIQMVEKDRVKMLDNFFVNIDGGLGIPGKNSDISSNQLLAYFLKDSINRNDVTGLGKYVIIKMVKAGINHSYIKKLTGYKHDIIDYCQEYIDSQNNDYDKSSYLDKKLSSIENFDIL
jgi:hypothetical protein